MMIFTALLLVLMVVVIEFAIVSGLYWGICWAFGLMFSWQIAVGVYLIWVIVHFVITALKKN